LADQTNFDIQGNTNNNTTTYDRNYGKIYPKTYYKRNVFILNLNKYNIIICNININPKLSKKKIKLPSQAQT